MNGLKNISKKIDLPILVFPLITVIALFVVFMVMPEQSTTVLDTIRGFLGNEMGLFCEKSRFFTGFGQVLPLFLWFLPLHFRTLSV